MSDLSVIVDKHRANRLAGWNVCEVSYFVSSGKRNLNSVNAASTFAVSKTFAVCRRNWHALLARSRRVRSARWTAMLYTAYQFASANALVYSRVAAAITLMLCDTVQV